MAEDDLNVPEKFKVQSRLLFNKESITEREFIDFCLLAVHIVDKHWHERQGIAYHISGTWLKYKNIQDGDILDAIGMAFGQLELPDYHIAKDEDGVRKTWEQARRLVLEADSSI